MVCLEWENHQSTVINSIIHIYHSSLLLDCAISAEGQTVRAHKIILAAASPYFQEKIKEDPCKEEFILETAKFEDLKVIVDFIYNGSVELQPEKQASFLDLAAVLKVPVLVLNPPLCDGTETEDRDSKDIAPVTALPPEHMELSNTTNAHGLALQPIKEEPNINEFDTREISYELPIQDKENPLVECMTDPLAITSKSCFSSELIVKPEKTEPPDINPTDTDTVQTLILSEDRGSNRSESEFSFKSRSTVTAPISPGSVSSKVTVPYSPGSISSEANEPNSPGSVSSKATSRRSSYNVSNGGISPKSDDSDASEVTLPKSPDNVSVEKTSAKGVSGFGNETFFSSSVTTVDEVPLTNDRFGNNDNASDGVGSDSQVESDGEVSVKKPNLTHENRPRNKGSCVETGEATNEQRIVLDEQNVESQSGIANKIGVVRVCLKRLMGTPGCLPKNVGTIVDPPLGNITSGYADGGVAHNLSLVNSSSPVSKSVNTQSKSNDGTSRMGEYVASDESVSVENTKEQLSSNGGPRWSASAVFSDNSSADFVPSPSRENMKKRKRRMEKKERKKKNKKRSREKKERKRKREMRYEEEKERAMMHKRLKTEPNIYDVKVILERIDADPLYNVLPISVVRQLFPPLNSEFNRSSDSSRETSVAARRGKWYRCATCKFSSKSFSSLEDHLRSSHQRSKGYNTSVAMSSKTSLSKDLKSSENENCLKCGKIIVPKSKRASLSKHLKSSGAKKYHESGKKMFRSSCMLSPPSKGIHSPNTTLRLSLQCRNHLAYLKEHLRTHPNDMPYSCRKCGLSYEKLTPLRRSLCMQPICECSC